MKKLFIIIYTYFFSLFASPKAKEKRVLAQGSKRLVKVLVEKETRKKEMLDWLREKTANGQRLTLHQRVLLLKKKFGHEMAERNIKIEVTGNKITLINARA